MDQVPFQFARTNRVFIRDARLIVTAEAPLEAMLEVRRALRGITGVETLSDADFDKALQQAFAHRQGRSADVMADLGDVLDLNEAAKLFEAQADLLADDDDAPVIRLLNSIFFEALQDRASDIHIECYEREARVRFRLDGTLQTVLTPPVQLVPRLISRIKVLARLDITEKRVPQDGRMSLQLGGRAIDLRVSTLPSSHGERVVMRLLEKQGSHLSVENLGMSAQELATLKALVARPHGIVLVTGPTGSGKTTTLYEALQTLNCHESNIMTVEDPVEYELPGISQTPISTKTGMTFARGLRAILRQDPDVILVGEIRDQETADIAVQASLTGHLVLSTLHTNSVAGAVTRLQDIGVDSFLLSSTLRGVIAQRLVRLLCPCCKMPVAVDGITRNAFEQDHGDSRFKVTPPASVFQAVGCFECNHTGYQGRRALFEVVEVSPELQRMIHDQVGELALELSIRAQVPSLYQRGLTLVQSGQTSLDEILRITLN